MELIALYKRVVGLDVHQAQITACALNPPANTNLGVPAKVTPYVRRLLCEFAHAASRTRLVFRSKFQYLVVRRGYKRAIMAIGHKILCTVFFMLKRHEHYRDSATDYEALSVQRNAPRWIKALIKLGLITPAKT